MANQGTNPTYMDFMTAAYNEVKANVPERSAGGGAMPVWHWDAAGYTKTEVRHTSHVRPYRACVRVCVQTLCPTL
jgi:hypothetical protein